MARQPDTPRPDIGHAGTGSPAAMLALQGAAGNRAACHALGGTAASQAIQRFVVYRAGGATENNMTPKPKDTTGNKKGLSTFEDPATAPIVIDKAQAIETDDLATPLTAVRNGTKVGDTHVSILPATDQDLIDWAARKEPQFPAYSQNVVAALTGDVWRPPKPKEVKPKK